MIKPDMSMAMAITCMLKSATMTACYDTNTASNGTVANTYNTLELPYYPPAARCENFFIPIHLNYSAPVFNATKWTNPYELQDFLSSITTRPDAKLYPAPLGEPKVYTGDYQLAASFCTPRNPGGKGNEKKVIVATHGIGPGRTHWNSPFQPKEFNFVEWAIDKGYSVLFYDRLGCGASSKIDGFEAQLDTAKTVLQQVALSVKEGKNTCDIKADKVALLSFSFASYTTHAAIAEKPEIADAIVLTGIGLNATGINGLGLLKSFVPRIASEEDPAKFGDRNPGYLTWPSVFDLIMNYFKLPSYAPATALFTESAKQPFSMPEFLTFSGPTAISADKWDKPALHITGEKDYIVCDGYCPGLIEDSAKQLYKNAKPLQVNIHPGASHHINFHANATGAYGVITDFLDKNL